VSDNKTLFQKAWHKHDHSLDKSRRGKVCKYVPLEFCGYFFSSVLICAAVLPSKLVAEAIFRPKMTRLVNVILILSDPPYLTSQPATKRAFWIERLPQVKLSPYGANI